MDAGGSHLSIFFSPAVEMTHHGQAISVGVEIRAQGDWNTLID